MAAHSLCQKSKDFAARYDFVPTISSPQFPRSNRLDKGVQVIKQLLEQERGLLFGPSQLQGVSSRRWPNPSRTANGMKSQNAGSKIIQSPPGTVRKHVQARNARRSLAPLRKETSSAFSIMVGAKPRRKSKTLWHLGRTPL